MPFRVQTAEAAGSGYSDYQFSNIVVNNSVQVAPSLDGPWEDKNFIRVSKNSSKFYVKVKVTLASLKPEDGPAKDSLAINQDKIVIPGWSNFNKTITNVGASFVSKMTPEQANAIAKRVAAGEKVGKGGIEVPCYRESTASTNTIAATVTTVVVVGALVAGTGGLAGAGAVALVGSGSSIAGLEMTALALSTYGVAGGAAIGGAGAAAGLAINPINGNEYVKCDSPVRPQPQNKGTVKVGDTLFEYTQEVTSANYQSALGMSASASKDPAAVNEFYVVPDFYFSVWNGARADDFMSSIGAGKSVYAQIYDTQAEVDQHKNDAAPAGVPNNGVNTGSGNNVNNTSDPVINFINQIIGTIIGWIQYLIFQIFTKLVSPLLVALLSIRTYTDAFAAVIYPGWEVVRNLCNILFIISLIAIAMGTLFRIESYQYKHMLVQLIIAALLVNFSLVMAQAVLGLADTMQNQFLPNNSNVVNALAKILIVDTKTAFNQMASSGDAGYFALTVTPFFNLALSIGSFLVFVAIMGFLLVRIVALWVLLMISPIAYAAGALPTTAHYRSEWWTNFIKYAFFTPIMAFFLNIVAVIGTAQQNNPILRQAVNGQNSLGSSSTISGFVVTIGSNLLLLLMLIAALKVAEQFGVMGADVASKVVKGGMMLPIGGIGFLGKKAGGRIGRWYNDRTIKILGEEDKIPAWRRFAYGAINPMAFWKMMGQRGKELQEASQHKAEAGGMMAAEQIMTMGHKVIPRIQQHAKAEADKFVKDYNQMSREKMVDVLKEVSQMGHSEEAMAMKRAITTAMESRGFIDDGVQDGTRTVDENGRTIGGSKVLDKMKKNEKFKIMDMEKDSTGKWKANRDWYWDSRDGQYKMKYNDYTMAAMMEALYGEDDQEAMRMLAEEGEKYGKDTFHSEYMRMAHYDLQHRKYRWSLDIGASAPGAHDGKQGKNFAAVEVSKMDARQQAKTVYHALMGLTDDGDMDERLLEVIEKNIRSMPDWMQERNPGNIMFGRESVDEKNFDVTDGSIKIDTGTFLRIKNITEQQKKGAAAAAIYLKGTAGALTGGRYDKDTVANFVKEIQLIQSGAVTDHADLKAKMIAATGNAKYETAINKDKVANIIVNKGIKMKVYRAEDQDGKGNWTGTLQTNVEDVSGHAKGGPAGANIDLTVAGEDIIKF